MVEASHSVQQAKVHASMGAAVMVLARQRAIKAVKRQFQARGLRPHHTSHREIIAAADAYLADHRAELIAEATPIVERWQAEGFFGKRARLLSDAQGGKR
jgi:hypothetical protein